MHAVISWSRITSPGISQTGRGGGYDKPPPRLLRKRTNIKRQALLLRQRPETCKAKCKSTNQVPLIGPSKQEGGRCTLSDVHTALTHTSCSAPPGREDAQIVLPHMLEHGKRHALSQHEVKSGFQEVTTCRRSRSSDDANQALSRHGSKLLPCLTTLHGLMGPAP